MQVARFHEVWVLTRPRYREAISDAVAGQPLENIRWLYFDLPRWARWWNKKDRGIHLHYYLWQVCAYFVGRRLHRQVGLNLVHHVTIACYWMPSFLALLPVPFVWGPVGGGDSVPQPFRKSLSCYGKVYETLRSLAQRLGRLDPFVRVTARRSEIGLATTPQTEGWLRALGCRKTAILSAIGLPSSERLKLEGFPLRQHDPFRAVSIGNLLHLKGFALGLRAFANIQPQLPASEYWIIGAGPEEKQLRRLAADLGVSGKVTFFGQLPRAQALAKLAHCDVLLHPSLHDSGGWVCLEAMAAGRPVICLDLGGPALQVTGETGIKVPASTPNQALADVTGALLRLATDRALRIGMGRASKRRVEDHFDWDRKGEALAHMYAEIAGEGRSHAC
jgi:glycosyltransferase involved in cell wall biosynthesis